jgi:adenylate cyclase
VTATLRSLASTFEGMIPPVIATCSATGEPNVTLLSSMQLVDDDHVAVSNQFFGKTVANIDENPTAAVLVQDHESGQLHRIRMHLIRRDTEGPIFDALSQRIDAIAAMTGMGAVFGLRSADIYFVDSCEPLA